MTENGWGEGGARRLIAEAEMVAEFLRAELESPRFAERIRQRLDRDGVDAAVLARPDTDDAEQNRYRRTLLRDYRGTGAAAELLTGFPDEIEWTRRTIPRDRLGSLRYIDYPFWNELSGGTRSPAVAAERMRAGAADAGHMAERFAGVIARMEAGETLPPIIAVAADEAEAPVLLEGHTRLTAWLLRPDLVPDPLDLIVGVGAGVRGWKYYGAD